MKNTDYFRNKAVTVVGLARSGLACANLLYTLGSSVSITDSQDTPQTRATAEDLRSPDIKVQLGRHTEDFINDRDLVVISPGVLDTALPVVWARTQGIPVISEIEVGWIVCPCPVIAVTGSSGKTTVTTLIGLILEEAGRQAFVCGNIGNPFTGEVARMDASGVAVLEVSSFQLEHIRTFKPAIAVITNISRNHLDRYPGMQEYIAAKRRIFLNQDSSDYLVLNSDDEPLRAWEHEARSNVVFFDREAKFNPNQTAVMAVGTILNIDKKICEHVCKEFKGLAHRMEEVAIVRGVRFINDSKATTAESCLWALESIKGSVILIAGGKDKGVDYRVIAEAARKKVKQAILIGEAKAKIRQALGSAVAMTEAASLEEAVRTAFAAASPGDSVLLSPMCSSFDMFSDYQHRGSVFKQAVAALAKEKA